jgi:hypothetical protein
MESADLEIAGVGGRGVARRAWVRAHAPLLVLGFAVLASVVLLLALSADLTYYQDSWAFLMHRRGFSADAFLEPHNEHIVLIPVAIEKLLLTIFGMSSAFPESVVLTLLLATTAVLVFVYVRRRLGPWPAVMAAALLLFIGPAWQVLLWPFEIGFAGSVMAGIAMLLMLEREDRLGDVAACALLALSLGFSTLGLSFAVAAVVDVLQNRRGRGLGRAFVFAIPLALFAAWYAGWGHTAESHLSLRNVLDSPRFLFEGLASSLDSVVGLSTIGVDGLGQPDWGRPLLVAAIVLIAYGQLRRPGFSPRLWPVAAATATFWLLAAFNYIPGREAVASRYTYAGSALLLLLTADLMRGVRFSRPALWVGAVVTLAAIAANIGPLEDGRDVLEEQTVLTRSDLGAIEIAERTVDPSFALTPEIAGTPSLIDVNAAEYLDAEREYGSPAYMPEELAGAAEAGRRQADIVLAQALPLSTVTYRRSALRGGVGGCTEIPGEGSGAPEIRLSPGVTRIGLAPGPHASFTLRRFAVGEYPVVTEGAPGDSVTHLKIPLDAAGRPWDLKVEAQQAARVCRPR